MRISLIAALSLEGVIGLEGGLPWRLPEDMKHFRRMTLGKTILMGRRTWEEVGVPLPRRRNLVLSRQADFRPEGAEVFADLASALDAAREDGELWVIGGHAVYAAALPLADRLHLTVVHGRPAGDVTFPRFDEAQWGVFAQRAHPAGPRHDHAMTFYELRRDEALPRAPAPFPAACAER
jgi:dihydrofolate reductase